MFAPGSVAVPGVFMAVEGRWVVGYRVNPARVMRRWVALLDRRIGSPLPEAVAVMSPEFQEGYREGLRLARVTIRRGVSCED
ncbi:hypothetical protein LV79_005826 [Actinokineospora globicatena]|nr:hypothetical protein [Actinokineospora globicatena]GLW80029.1 hypothetical protein Aglo01_45100 [Actinokineospora globicatena]GLW86858.1 hypothetical protein Aglo02_44970 [Actinokineospora globicatena]